MKNLNALIPRRILFFLLLFGVNLFAQNFEFTEIPKLVPIKLLNSISGKKIHILVAREIDGSNHYLIINDSGKIYSPKVGNGSMVYFDGSFDFYLESGERILLPVDLRRNSLNTTLPPSILYPDKAPVTLKEIKISTSKLKKLSFSQFIGKAPSNSQENSTENYQFFKNLEKSKILRIRFTNEEIDFRAAHNISKKIELLGPAKVRVLEIGGGFDMFSKPQISMIVNQDVIGLATAQIPKSTSYEVDIFDAQDLRIKEKQQSLPLGKFLELTNNLEKAPFSFKRNINSIATILANQHHFDSFSESEKIQTIKGVLGVLRTFEEIHARLKNLAGTETAIADARKGLKKHPVGSMANYKRAENHELVRSMVKPIRQIARMIYEILDVIDHPIAREIIVETSSALDGTALSILRGSPSKVKHSYFQEWLIQLRRENLDLIERLPTQNGYHLLNEQQLTIDSRSGGIFYQLQIPGEVFHLKSIAQTPVDYRTKQDTQQLPTVLFGLPGDKAELKHQFIQYIIETDRATLKLLDWIAASKSNGSNYEIIGNSHITKLITQLPYAPTTATIGLSDFSEIEYRKTVVQILQQLLEIANTSIATTGTHASLLDAALHIVREVDESKYDLNSQENAELLRESSKLQSIINKRLLNGIKSLGFANTKNAGTCKILFSPNPRKTALESL